MWIIGCDFHPRYQQVAALNQETGEIIERRLGHETKEAEAFYQSLPQGAQIGMEATCTAQWFERLLNRCGHQLLVGDPATIRASVVRKQKTDPRDARQLLELLLTNRFPSIWIPTAAERDTRQLLVHRHKLVGWRTQVRNQLSALARNQGLLPRTRFWTRPGRQQLESLPLDPWAARRRQDLLQLLDQLDPQIAELSRQAEQQAQARSDAVQLMQQDGVGPRQASGQLSGIESQRTQQRRSPATRPHQQTRQPDDALVAGRSRLDRRSQRSGTGTRLPTTGLPPRSQDRCGGGSQKVGGEVVLAVARFPRTAIRATGSHAGPLGVRAGECRRFTVCLIGHPASLGTSRGSSQ